MRLFRSTSPAQADSFKLRLGFALIAVFSSFLIELAVRPASGRVVLSPEVILATILLALVVVVSLHVRFLLRARREYQQSANALIAAESEYKSVFDYALDGIVIVDDRRVCLDANSAAIRLLGTRFELLVGNSIDSFFPDRHEFQSSWTHLLACSSERREARILRRDNRGAFVEYGVKGNYLPGRHVTVMRDITGRKLAEERMVENLHAAQAARAEAEAFRKTTLALTQDLSMDNVLDAFLKSLLELIPCESAQVLLVESETRLFLAREAGSGRLRHPLSASPATFDAKESRFLMEALVGPKSFLVRSTSEEATWPLFEGFEHLGSWLCVPLVASDGVVGLLSLGDSSVETFSADHLRIAQSLAIPAAVAIQNARLYEQTAIFRLELEQTLSDFRLLQESITKNRIVGLA